MIPTASPFPGMSSSGSSLLSGMNSTESESLFLQLAQQTQEIKRLRGELHSARTSIALNCSGDEYAAKQSEFGLHAPAEDTAINPPSSLESLIARVDGEIHAPMAHAGLPFAGIGSVICSRETLMNYKITDHLAESSSGIFFTCVDYFGQKLIAKLAHPFRAHPDSVRDPVVEWSRDTQILLSLNHPNVLRLYDAFRYQGKYCMVSEESVGTLSLLLQQKAFDAWDILLATSQILAGLDYFHNRHLLHRDLTRSE